MKNVANLMAFFDILWKSKEGYVRTAVGNKKDKTFKEIWFHWPNDKENMQAFYEQTTPQQDYYYSVVLFNRDRGLKEYALPTNWLWSDLDEANPGEFSKQFPQPTVTVETSPNRYQGLWYLTENISPDYAEQLSKGIAYSVDADKSGWDVGQLLRVPYTHNTKYDSLPQIKLLVSSSAYQPKVFEPYKMGAFSAFDNGDVQELIDYASSIDPQEVIDLYNLLSKPFLEELILGLEIDTCDDRSSRLWALGMALTELQLSTAEVISVLQVSPYNKFAGEAREWRMLAQLAIKAEEMYQERSDQEYKEKPRREKKLVGLTAKELNQKEFPPLGWVIENLIPDDEPVIISATYQSRKTFMALEIAIALATGCPVFGYFKTNKTGNVMYIQEELSDRQMQARLRMICNGRGVDVPDNLFIFNKTGFLFDNGQDRQEVEDFIVKHKIKYVFFDPLGKQLQKSDVMSFRDMNNIMEWLVSLEKRFDITDFLVHHMNKHVASKRLSDQITGSTAIPNHFACKLGGHRMDKGRTIKVERAARGSEELPDFIVTYNHNKSTGEYSTTIQEMLGVDEEQHANEISAYLKKQDVEFEMTVPELSRMFGHSEQDIHRYVQELQRQNKCLMRSRVVNGSRTLFVGPPIATAETIERELELLGQLEYES